MTESPFNTGDKYYLPAPKPNSTNLKGIIGTVIGIAVGRYVGINFIVPAVFIGLAYLLYCKLLFKNKTLFFTEASILLCGHAAWGVTGVIFLEINDQGLEQFALIVNIIEFAIYLGLSFFLLKSPSFGLAMTLIILEIVMIVVNSVYIKDQPFGSDGHRALTAHLALRAAIVFGAFSGLKKINDQEKQRASSPEVSTTEPDQNGS